MMARSVAALGWLSLAGCGALSDPPEEHGTCDVSTEGLPVLDGARRVGTDGGYTYGTPSRDLWNTVTPLSTDADYVAYLASVGASTIGSVDFTTEAAVAFLFGASSTCGASLAGWTAYDHDGVPHVVADFNDSSHACASVCDMEQWQLVIVAVPRAASAPTGCLRIGGGCGAEL